MALSALRGKTADAETADAVFEIGAEGARIIECPTCSRPIDGGALRCPGCGTRFLLEVPLKRASVFLATGAVVGLLVGGSLMGAAASVSRPLGGAQSTAGPVPTASGAVGPAASARPGGAAAPPVAGAGLRQAVAINARLASGVEALRTTLAAKPFESSEVASNLRALLQDASVGMDAATRLKGWGDAAAVHVQLVSLYEAVRSTARSGLSAALSNEAAYKTAGSRMISVLGGVTAADAAARALATDGGVVVPAPVGP
jgi:hypothetical protein